jgi:hypothetical protein
MGQVQAVTGLSTDERAQTLSAAWDSLLERIAYDWSHLLAEVELETEVPYEDVALAVSPLNPERCQRQAAFRFRVGHDFGYGVPAVLARRCLESLDAAGVEGRLRLLEVLSERRSLDAQGPVWRLEGRSL